MKTRFPSTVGLALALTIGVGLMASPPDASSDWRRPSSLQACWAFLKDPPSDRAQSFLSTLSQWRLWASKGVLDNYLWQVEAELDFHLSWALMLKSPRFDQPILSEIKTHYDWADHHAKTLRRIYDRILIFTLPEIRSFQKLASQVGAKAAFEQALAARARFHRGGSRGNLDLQEIRRLIQELQALLATVEPVTYRTGPAHFVLGGSVVNGSAHAHSDLDGGPLPLHLLSEPAIVRRLEEGDLPTARKWLSRLDYRLLTSSAQIDPNTAWKKYGSLWNLQQSFALKVYANRIELTFFQPQSANRNHARIHRYEIPGLF